MVKVGINGFGRIGRISFRIWLLKYTGEMDIAAINTSGSMDVAGWAHLANYDTIYRKFEYEVKAKEVRKPEEVTSSTNSGQVDEDPLIGYLLIGEKNIKVPVLAQRDPAKIPWGKYGVDVVIESTGKFTKEEDAKKHALGGAKRVGISAPAKGGNVGTYVIGVNEYKEGEVINNAS